MFCICKNLLTYSMNFLAHIYLSGENDYIKIGNFMADSLQGRKPETFIADIKKGILLHRAIDTFTDAHPVFRQGTKRLHPVYHHYAGVIMDIYYDHFLAKNWNKYSTIPLTDFASDFYSLLKNNTELLTEQTKSIIPYITDHNWLVSYSTVQGIGRTLSQMDKRTRDKSGMRYAVKELLDNYKAFEDEFTLFFEELIVFSRNTLCQL